MQEIAVEFVYSKQQKMKNFYPEDDNGKLRVKVTIVTFPDAIATVDVLGARNNVANLSKFE